MVINQSAEAAFMAAKVKALYELRRMIADAQKRERDLTDEIKGWMHEDGTDVLDIEGAPPCKLKTRSTGIDWDSHAITTLIDQRPQEWRKLVELGAVSLRASVIKLALKNGNLAAPPLGGHEGSTDYLTFEVER